MSKMKKNNKKWLGFETISLDTNNALLSNWVNKKRSGDHNQITLTTIESHWLCFDEAVKKIKVKAFKAIHYYFMSSK